jgi:hypothetical protein
MDDKHTVIGHDLDHLFGTWKELHAQEFLESIQPCAQLDEVPLFQPRPAVDSHP